MKRASVPLLSIALAAMFGTIAPVMAQPPVPLLVDTTADLAAQTPGPELGWADSIYFTSRIQAGGRNLGLLVHVVSIPNGPGQKIVFSVTDEETGFYKYHVTQIEPDEFHWSKDELHITAPGLNWRGNAQSMDVSLDVPWASLDFKLVSRGPAMIYGGTGAFPLFGHVNHEFAFPSMQTSGSLTLDGETHPVEGLSWLDRQWGPVTPKPDTRWSWINFNLPNGDVMAIWDAVSLASDSYSWVTAMRADGTHVVAAVQPLAEGADEIWTSEETGNTYPSRWRIIVPALDADLTVDVTGTERQEIVIHGDGRMEATASYAGTYDGKEVSGLSYVELFGDWSSPPPVK